MLEIDMVNFGWEEYHRGKSDGSIKKHKCLFLIVYVTLFYFFFFVLYWFLHCYGEMSGDYGSFLW